MINPIALQALSLANVHGDGVEATLDRAKKYMKFIAQEQKVTRFTSKKDDTTPVQTSESFEDVQNAGFILAKERGPEALRDVLDGFKIKTIQELPKKFYGDAIKKLRDKLVEGEGLI